MDQIDSNCETLILNFIDSGYKYEEILELLRVRNGVLLSLSTFKRWLRRKGIKCRPVNGVASDPAIIQQAITE